MSGKQANAMHHNRTVYEAEEADIARAGKQIRILKRIKAGSPLETVEDVETMDVAQARELRESLEEAINRA